MRGLVRSAGRGARLGVAAVVLVAFAAPVSAQGTCNVPNGPGTCSIADAAAQAATITITRAVRAALSSASIALSSPIPADYDAGYGQTTGPTLTIKANAPWSLAIHSSQSTWTASGTGARAAKPIADLQWAVSVGGPFTNFTTSATGIGSGSATSGTDIALYFRVKYAWALDTPGNYSVPVQITLTAP